MKRLFLSFAFITALLTSCVTDSSEVTNQGGEVKVTIGIDIPELATRSGETAMNSGLGAIDNFNFDGSEWDSYDVRYMLEVYDVTEGFENLDTPIKQRYTNTHGKYEPTNFEIHLIPNRDYRFVVWADFVAEGTNTDLHYNTADLKAITRTSAAVAMDECQDAYFIQKDLRVNVGGLSESLTLKRPFGKIRVITTDHDEVNLGSAPAKVEVKFYNHKLFTSLNAVTGEASGDTLNEYTYEVTKETSPYTQGYDGYAQNMTLFADYILAGDDTVGAQEVNFTMTVWGKDNREIRTHDFNTQIPLERNHLTTIVGNLLTTANDISITIDDDFDGEYINDWGKDAINIANGDWGYGTINANGNYEFLISDGANYFTLIAPASAVDSTGKLALISEAEYVASEAELVDGTFTIRDLMVDPTRAAEAATVKSGTMNVSGWTDGWTDGVYVQLDLYYTFDAEADPAEYHNIRYQYTGEVYGEVPATILEIVKHDIAYNNGGEIEYNFYVNDNEYYRFDFFTGQTNDDGSTKMMPGTYTLVPDAYSGSAGDILGGYSYKHNVVYFTSVYFTSATVVVTELEDGRFQFDAQFKVEGDDTNYVFSYIEKIDTRQERTITVKVEEAITEMYFYSWTENENQEYLETITADWPGDWMLPTGTPGEFTYTYSKEWDGQIVNLIFNNGQGSQTEDIKGVVLDGDKYYERYDIVVPPVVEPGNDVYSVIGNFTVGYWDTDIELVDNGNGVLVARDVEFANDNNDGCVFKIRKNYTWVYNWGANTPEAFGLNTEIDLTPDSSNIKVDAEFDKKYDIYVNLDNMYAWVEEQGVADGLTIETAYTFTTYSTYKDGGYPVMCLSGAENGAEFNLESNGTTKYPTGLQQLNSGAWYTDLCQYKINGATQGVDLEKSTTYLVEENGGFTVEYIHIVTTDGNGLYYKYDGVMTIQ